MTNAPRWTIAVIAVSIPALAHAAEMPKRDEAIRKSISLALPYLEKGGVQWMKRKKCVSCHRVSFLIWSHREARRIGIAVDEMKLQEWTDWSIGKLLAKRKEDSSLVATRNLDGVGQMLLARSHGKPKGQPRSAQYATLLKLLIEGQLKTGSWKAYGQLPFQKRPKAETSEVSTMWAVIALADVEQTAPVKKARKQAIAFLNSAPTGKSVEWFAARLLTASADGDSPKADTYRGELLRLQRADGGWPWLVGGESDAMATGQVLYVLSRVRGDNSAAIRRAQSFLLRTQRKNGSWAVKGTKAKKQQRPQETSNYWGTAWAVIGMARTLE